MSRARSAAAAVAFCATVAAGCGIGPGDDQGDVELTVTRDYGSDALVHESDSVNESDTVLRVLDRSAEIETRYGGGFVQSIDGIAGEQGGGRRSDWFFYVNGVESPVGAAEYKPGEGDRIWWDYRDWSAAMRVPAVVGSWPEPFVHGFQGHRYGAQIECRGVAAQCDQVARRLEAEGVTPDEGEGAAGEVQVLVGPWDRLRRDETAKLLARGPGSSGVFATFSGTSPGLLNLLDEQGQLTATVGHGAGLVAALRPGDGPPTWVVTGTDDAGVSAAAAELGDGLRNRYAVAVTAGGGPIGVPYP